MLRYFLAILTAIQFSYCQAEWCISLPNIPFSSMVGIGTYSTGQITPDRTVCAGECFYVGMQFSAVWKNLYCFCLNDITTTLNYTTFSACQTIDGLYVSTVNPTDIATIFDIGMTLYSLGASFSSITLTTNVFSVIPTGSLYTLQYSYRDRNDAWENSPDLTALQRIMYIPGAYEIRSKSVKIGSLVEISESRAEFLVYQTVKNLNLTCQPIGLIYLLANCTLTISAGTKVTGTISVDGIVIENLALPDMAFERIGFIPNVFMNDFVTGISPAGIYVTGMAFQYTGVVTSIEINAKSLGSIVLLVLKPSCSQFYCSSSSSCSALPICPRQLTCNNSYCPLSLGCANNCNKRLLNSENLTALPINYDISNSFSYTLTNTGFQVINLTTPWSVAAGFRLGFKSSVSDLISAVYLRSGEVNSFYSTSSVTTTGTTLTTLTPINFNFQMSAVSQPSRNIKFKIMFNSTGQRSVTLNLKAPDNIVVSASTSILIGLTINDTTFVYPSVTLTNHSYIFLMKPHTGDVLQYYWVFGDTTTLNTTSYQVNHTYTTSGTYNFTVFVFNLVTASNQSFIMSVKDQVIMNYFNGTTVSSPNTPINFKLVMISGTGFLCNISGDSMVNVTLTYPNLTLVLQWPVDGFYNMQVFCYNEVSNDSRTWIQIVMTNITGLAITPLGGACFETTTLQFSWLTGSNITFQMLVDNVTTAVTINKITKTGVSGIITVSYMGIHTVVLRATNLISDLILVANATFSERISALQIIATPLFVSNGSAINFAVNMNTGSGVQSIIYYSDGNNSTFNSSLTSRWVNNYSVSYIFQNVGTYNVTVNCTNIVNSMVAWVLAFVLSPLGTYKLIPNSLNLKKSDILQLNLNRTSGYPATMANLTIDWKDGPVTSIPFTTFNEMTQYTHSYSTNGIYNVTMTLTNPINSVVSYVIIYVINPVTNLKCVNVPQNTWINNSMTMQTFTDSGDYVVYIFVPGDGTPSPNTTKNVSALNTEYDFTHTYSSVGNYTQLIAACNPLNCLNCSNFVQILYKVTLTDFTITTSGNVEYLKTNSTVTIFFAGANFPKVLQATFSYTDGSAPVTIQLDFSMMPYTFSKNITVPGPGNVTVILSNLANSVNTTSSYGVFQKFSGFSATVTWGVTKAPGYGPNFNNYPMNQPLYFRPSSGSLGTVSGYTFLYIPASNLSGIYNCNVTLLNGEFNYTFTTMDTFNVSLKVYNPLDFAFYEITVIISGSIKNTQISTNPAILLPNYFGYLYITWTVISVDSCICVDFANGTKLIYGATTGCTNCTGYTYTNIQPVNSMLIILVKFVNERDYNINVSISNKFESVNVNKTIPVTFSKCLPPVLSMFNVAYINVNTPQIEFRSSQITVSAVVVDLPCAMTKNNFKLWTATMIDTSSFSPLKTIILSSIDTKNNTQLIIPPRFLDYGLYLLTFTVTMDMNVTIFTFQSSNQIYLQIIPSPIIVGLSSGGISQIINGIQQTICFTPLVYSQDPDLNVQTFANWTWLWTCRQSNETMNLNKIVYPQPANFAFSNPKTGCFGNGPGVVNFTTSPCFAGSNFDVNNTYVISLNASTNDMRHGYSTISIMAVNGIPPNITVQCLRPLMCQINKVGPYAYNEVVFNPSDALLLSATCVQPTGLLCTGGSWKIIIYDQMSLIWVPIDSTTASSYIKGISSLQMSLLTQFFSNYSSVQRFQICYTSSGILPFGQACIQFYIFPLPSGVTCSLNMNVVKQTDTVCSTCTYQFTYQYRIYVNASGQLTTLGFATNGQFCSIIPYQETAQIYIVRVTNTNGGYIDVIVSTVLVQTLNQTDMNGLLNSLLTGTDQTLTLAIAKGDFKDMSQVYLKYVSVLTVSNQNTMQTLTNNSKSSMGGSGYTTPSGNSNTMTVDMLPPAQKAAYEADRDRKSSIINTMTAGLYTMVPADIKSLHLITSVVVAISGSYDCLNRQSQWQLSTKLSSLATSLKAMQQTATRDDINTIATNLLQANFLNDAATNIQINSGINRDIQYSKNNYLDYDTNLESSAKSFMGNTDPNAASLGLTKETNSNFQSKIASGVGSNSQNTLGTITKVLRDIKVINDPPTEILTSALHYFSSKTTINEINKAVLTKGRSTVQMPDLCNALNMIAAQCSNPNNPIGLEVVATPNNVRSYLSNTNANGAPIPTNSDMLAVNLYLGTQDSERSASISGNSNSVTVFLSRDPVFPIPDFNFSTPDPQIADPLYIPGTGTAFSGPLCFEQKLVMFTFTLTGSDQSVHFQIKSNFQQTCTQYLVVGRCASPPVLATSPDGTVDPVNFTFWGMIPTDTKYCNMAAPSTEPDPFTVFVSNYQFNQSKLAAINSLPDYSKTLNTLYFGVRELHKEEWNLYTSNNRPPVPYSYSGKINNTFRTRIFSTSCLANSNNFQSGWSTSGCTVGPLTTTSRTQCICNHLTTFASGWVVAPNTIDFNYVFSNFDFTKNMTLFITEIVLCLVFILIFVWARRQDIKDIEKVGVTPLPSNDSNDMYLYEVTIDTSIRVNAGTSSNVYFILSGELDETDCRHLVDSKRPILKRGNVDRFLLAVPRPLGILQYIRLWHDNSGKGKLASWYCNYFGVTDLQTKEKFHFLVNNWFAVEEEDGQIDRLVAVASVSELQNFEEVFSRKMKMNLSEDHLWLSIMARPPESRFTRVERVACCLLLLFLTMLTTCMFYQSEGPTSTTNNVLTVGPFAITPREVWTGLISNIIAFVPLFIIIELFRKSQLKHGHANKLRLVVEDHLQISIQSTDNKGYQASTATLIRNEDMDISRPTTPGYQSTDQISIHVVEADEEVMQKKIIRKSLLPWWTRIIVWGFLTLLLIVAVVFTTFYGIQFGDIACKKWITSMFISFFASVLLTQPIKVIFIAIFFSLVCKKSSTINNIEFIDEEEELMNELGRRNGLMQNEEYLHNELYTAPIKPHRVVVQPPPKEELEKARELRLKELQMFDVFREIMFYIVFFCTLIFVTYSLRDPNSFMLKNELTRIFITPNNPDWQFTGITREDQFWTWALNVLVPGIRAPIWYNNDPQLYQRGFISNRNNRLIGYAILRQVRTKKDSCKVYDYVKQLVKHCYSGYDVLNQDEGTYSPGWNPVNANNTATPEFSFVTESSLNAIPYIGRIGVYSGGGFVYQLRSNVSNLFKDISALRDNHWIDFQTRAIFVEFTTYNPNINLFAINTFVVELPGSGGMWPIYRVEPANLLGLYSGGVKAFEIFCQVLYGIFIICMIVKEIRNIMKQKWKYFSEFWNLCEVFMICGSFAAVGGFVYVTLATSTLTDKFNKYSGNIYLNFGLVAFWNENLGYLVSFIVFVATIKFIRLLRFNKRIGMLGSVLSYCGKDMRQFFIIFAIMFLAFVMVFYSLFMDTLYRYHTFLFATEASMQIALGKFAFLELYQKEPIFGPIVFAGYVLFIIFVLLNMFIAILTEGFETVKEDIELQGNDYELASFIMTKFIIWTGISNTKIGKKFIKTGITDQIYKDIDSRHLTDKIDEFPEKIEQLLNHITRMIYDGKKGYDDKDKQFSSIMFEKPKSIIMESDDNIPTSRPTTASSNILKNTTERQMTPIGK